MLVIILLKPKIKSKIKSEYLDLFIKRLPLTDDQDEDVLCNSDKSLPSVGLSFLSADRTRRAASRLTAPRSVSMRPVKQMLSNMLPLVRSLGHVGSEPIVFTS